MKKLEWFESLAICKRTYPDEDDMRDFCNEEIELNQIKIYFKGKKYVVITEFCDKYYWELIK